MTISELARKTNTSLPTIRYYERRGLLPRPHRWPDSGYRDFDDETVAGLGFISAAKSMGFTLAEIKQLLDLRIPPRGSCAEVEVHFRKKAAELDRRMHEMRQMRRMLGRMAAACAGRARDKTCLALWAIGAK